MKQGVFYTAAAGVLMALLVFAGCSGPFDREAGADSDQHGAVVAQSRAARARPTEPGNGADLAPTQAPGGKGNAVKMVPFLASGTWAVGGMCFDSCEGNTEWYSVFGIIEGTGTQTGRLRVAETVCIRKADDEYMSHSGILTAANGDELHFRGCRDAGSMYEFDLENDTFRNEYVELVGGTGRLVDATGWYSIEGTGTPATTRGGTWELEGEISSVGSSK